MKFGICTCDLDSYDPKIENLIEFSDYDTAFSTYLTKITEEYNKSSIIPKNIWLVWIENDKVIQLDQLKSNTKCKIISL